MTDQSLSYRIIYSRRRSIGIIVTPEKGVIVRAPLRTSTSAIEKFVVSKSSWIRKHLDDHSGMIRLNYSSVADGMKILFRGAEYMLRIGTSPVTSVRLGDEEILVNIKDPYNRAVIIPLLGRWYKKNAENIIPVIWNDILERHKTQNFKPLSLSLRTMKRRWGSCSNRGKITLNSELVKLDDRLTEYVILHELCHLKHHNHGKEFYSLLSEVSPGWKGHRKELRKYIN